MRSKFANRKEAGELLARHLEQDLRDRDFVLIALPRGGASVAFQIARRFNAALHTLIVRKLGAPQQPELAIGAIASGGFIFLNQDLIERLRIAPDEISKIRKVNEFELHRREEQYRAAQPNLDIGGKEVLIIDDGVATGATMEVAIRAVKAVQPKSLRIAVPIAALAAIERLHRLVDHVYSLRIESELGSISEFYEDFPEVTDDEVIEMLSESKKGVNSDLEK